MCAAAQRPNREMRVGGLEATGVTVVDRRPPTSWTRAFVRHESFESMSQKGRKGGGDEDVLDGEMAQLIIDCPSI